MPLKIRMNVRQHYSKKNIFINWVSKKTTLYIFTVICILLFKNVNRTLLGIKAPTLCTSWGDCINSPSGVFGVPVKLRFRSGDHIWHGLDTKLESCGCCFTSGTETSGNNYRQTDRDMFYLMTHSTHFIYGYMASDIWLRTILIVRMDTRCRHIGYSYRLTARVLLYAPSHRQDNTYHGLGYTSRGVLAETRNSSMGPLHEGLIRRPIAPWANALPLSYVPLPSGNN